MINSDQSRKPLLELRNIAKCVGRHQALKNISFEIYPGTITALIGDNGAGKSTLAKIITGYHPADAGEIYWYGELLRFSKFNGPIDARRRGIQVVYQHLGLIDNLSLWRNFFLGNELIKGIVPFKRLDSTLMQEITLLQLNEFGLLRKLDVNMNVSKLSGGERQAIAICRAKYFNSKLLILDEPTSALSHRQANDMMECIKAIAKANVAVIFITHRIEHVLNIADRVIALYQGAIAANEQNKNLSYDYITKMINREN